MKLLKVRAHNFRSYQDLELDFQKTKGLILVRGNLPQSSESSNNGSGKAQPYSERVMTPQGIKTMGSLKIGDYVYNRKGRAVRVSDIFEKGELEVFDVITADGRHIKVNNEHLFSYWTPAHRNSRGEVVPGHLIEKALQDMVDSGLYRPHSANPKWKAYKYLIPLSDAVEYPESPLKYDPYTVGALLGDGYTTARTVQFSGDTDKEFILNKIVSNNPNIFSWRKNSEYNFTHTFKTIEGHGAKVVDFNLPDEIIHHTEGKRVPKDIFQGSIKQRLEFIQGLFDTDGSCYINNTKGKNSRNNLPKVSLSSINKFLVEEVIELLRSLGYKATYSTYNRVGQSYKDSNYTRKTEEYSIHIDGSLSKLMNLFSNPVKKEKIATARDKRSKHYDRSAIVDVVDLGYKEPMRCIYVDDPEHLYVSGDYVVSHNTTMYNSILYALYGKVNGNGGDSVVNIQVGKGTYVILELQQNGHQYRIERYRKHKENKNKVLLFEDDKDISLPSNKETDKKIIEVVGLNEDTMLNSLVFGSNNMVSFVNATDKQRKEMLEELTGIQIYQQALELVKEDAKNASESSLTLSNDLQGIISRISSNRALKQQYDASMTSYEQTKKSYQDKLDNMSSEEIDEPALKQQLKELKTTLKTVQDKRNSIKLESFDNNQLNQVTSTMSSVKYSFNQDKKKMQDLANQIKTIQTSPKSYCSLCGSLLDEEHKQQEIASLTSQGKETRQEYDKLLKQAPGLKEQYDTLLAQQQSVSEHNASIVDKQNELQEQINSFTTSINQIQNKLDSKQKTEDNVAWLKQQLKELTQPAKPDIVDEFELMQQQSEIEKQQANLEVKQAQLKKLTDVFGLRGVKSHVLGSVLPFVNKRIDHYLEILTEGKFTATISSKSTTKSGSVNEKMSIDITSQDTGSEYSELSSGEQRRVDLAVSMSLQDYLLSKVPDVNLEVYDEVLDNLDGAGVQAVMSILQEKAKTVDTILVISHNEDLKDNFEQSILVEKVNGISQIS